jgi:hypothetical protein
MPEKFPLLTQNNNYYAVAFNYTQTHKIIREHGINLPFYDDLCNVFTMFSYLWLFNKYVVNVCIDDEETAIAYDELSVKGGTQTVLIPTHKSLYLLFNKMVDIIKKEGTLPFLLSDLEQVLFDEKDYMYFQLQQIKRYVLQDDFIEVVEEKVDEAKVDEPPVSEAKVDEATVSEAKVDEPSVDKPPVGKEKVDEPTVGKPSVDTPSVDTPSVDTPSVDTPSVDTPSVDKPPVGKEIILKFIKEANDEEQTVNTELSRLSETDKFDDLLKYAIDRNLTRYGMFYMYNDYLTYISTLSIKKSTPNETTESSSVDDKSGESIVSQEQTEQPESSEEQQEEQKPSYGGIHKKKASKINRKAKVHRVTKNKRKVSESRKSKNKQRSKRKLLAKKKRGTRKNNRKNRK